MELAIVQQAAEQELFLPLEPEPEDEREYLLWEAQNVLLLRYLSELYGANAPVQLALMMTEESDFETAFQEFTGLTIDQFYRRWQPWVMTQGAVRAISWSPYMATTPTNTPTRTPSPIPPTHTPTLTPTITLTPTSTSLVERQPSPFRPTATPLVISRQNTPTNTPLPPGSLPTLAPPTATRTPLPETPASSDNGDNGNSGLPCGAAALVVPVLGVVLFNKRRIWRA